MLHGREPEQRAIEELIAAARAGQGRLLVVRGEPGIGKTALLDHAAERAADAAMPVLRVGAVEAEQGTPFAALHSLLQPVLDRVDRLAEPQAAALCAALGLASAGPPESLHIGLAVRALLAEAAPEGPRGSGGPQGPVLCVVDDAQWLDRASADALAFAARRLGSGSVSMLVAAREGDWPWSGLDLPCLWPDRLDAEASGTLLAARGVTMVPQVRRRLVDEAGGNPLALLELSAALGGEQRAGRIGPALPDCGAALPPSRVRESFRARVRAVPDPVRRLLLVAAAADGAGLEPVLAVARSAGGGPQDLDAAERAGLVRVEGGQVAFRHPLIRAAVLEDATFGERTAAHLALAEAYGAGSDTGRVSAEYADRRAWHLASAVTGPDEAVAARLERAGRRARDGYDMAAASAAFERAARLSADPHPRLRRLVVAAEAALAAGHLDRAAGLAREAAETSAALDDRGDHGTGTGAADRVTPADRATLVGWARVQAAVEHEQGRPAEASRLLLETAHRIGPDPGERRDGRATVQGPHDVALLLAYAVHYAVLSGDGRAAEAAAQAARAGLFAVTAGRTAGASAGTSAEGGDPADAVMQVAVMSREVAGLVPGPLRSDLRAVRAAVRAVASASGLVDVELRLLAAASSLLVGDHCATAEIATAVADFCRAHEMYGPLGQALILLAEAHTARGRHREARAIGTEAHRLAMDLRYPRRTAHAAGILAWLAAAAGDEPGCGEPANETAEQVRAGSTATVRALGGAAFGLLELGRCRPAHALERLEDTACHPVTALRHSADLIEAAVCAGRPEQAHEPFARLQRWADRSGQTTLNAVMNRCRALLASGKEADAHYRTALQLHQLSDQPFEQARTELLYGQWLRRARRRGEARERLQSALTAFEAIGSASFAARARRELQAARGGPRRVRDQGGGGPDAAHPLDALTPQERQVVRLAATGETSREIAARLFLSPRTIEHHLYKAFRKLGVSSRTELTRLAGDDADLVSAAGEHVRVGA